MKKVVTAALLVFVLSLSIFFWQVWQNNRDIPPVAEEKVLQHFERSVQWLNDNYTQLQNNRNPILWWFIKQAAQQSGDPVLSRLYHQFKRDIINKQAVNLSTPLFDDLYRPRLPDITMMSHLDDYQVFFFYAFSCDDDYARESLIQNQMEPEYCQLHYIRSRCVTHQLMGLRFMQRFDCGYDDKVNITIGALQETVLSELTWDFRITDSYIQRILMLLDTGAADRIKPVWIKSMLDAQNNDGSWDDLHPLLDLPGGKVLALSSTTLRIQKPKASFHATSQAIWLMSLMLSDTAGVKSN